MLPLIAFLVFEIFHISCHLSCGRPPGHSAMERQHSKLLDGELTLQFSNRIMLISSHLQDQSAFQSWQEEKVSGNGIQAYLIIVGY